MHYRFTTVWHIESPIEAVCEVIYLSLHWPQWWRNVVKVEELDPGDALGLGGVRRYTWKGILPYHLTFDICVSDFEPFTRIEGIASGDVEGIGRWSFSTDGRVTKVHYEWRIRTTPKWMNLFAPIARPFIRWNHDVVMQQGGVALARKLNARLLENV